MVVVAVVGVTLALVVGGRANNVPTISAPASWSHVGQEVSVKFLVRSTNVQGGRELLNAAAVSSERSAFSAVLADSLVRQSTHDPADFDFGHTVFVTGVVRIVHGQPEVLVTTPAQISAPNAEAQ